ncbi:MAG TPA: hypothetical protein VF595_01140 [Tepidisphaeraceae bacterium]|jgi:hypothetical protein
MAAASGIEAGNAFIRISAKDQYSTALTKLENKLRNIGEAASEVGRRMALGGAAAAAGILAATKAYATVGDAVAKASTRTGIAAETISELGYAAEQSGTDLAGLEAAIIRMGRKLTEAAGGSKEAGEAFTGIGLSIQQLSSLSLDQQFKNIADAVAAIPNPTERASAAIGIFGKSGASLLPLMASGARGIEELQAAARRLGNSMSGQDATAAEEFGDRLDDLGKVAQGVVFQIGAALAPTVREYAVSLTDSLSAVINWIKQNRESVQLYAEMAVKAAALTVAIGGATFAIGKFIAIGSGLIGIAGKIGVAITAVTSLSKATAAASAVMAANPIGIAIVGLGAILAAKYAWDEYTRTVERAAAVKLDNQQAEKIAEDARKARDETQGLINILAGLNSRGVLTPADAETAQKTIAALTAKYGDLGFSIDAATGKLVGFIDGYKQLNAVESRREIVRQTAVGRDAASRANAIGRQITTYEGPDLMGLYAEQKKQQERAAEAFNKAAQLRGQLGRNGETGVFDGATAPVQVGTGTDDEASDAKQTVEDRKRLNELAKQQRLAGLSEEARKIEELNDRYTEQYEIMKRLYAEADKKGDTAGRLGIENEARAAYAQLQSDVAKVQEETQQKQNQQADRAVEDAANTAQEIIDNETQKEVALLKLQQEYAEKSGDAAKAKALKRQIADAEFEKTLTDTFGSDEAAKSQARDIRRKTADLPEIRNSSQGTFDVAATGQSLQGGGTLDRIAKAAEATAKHTKEIAKKKTPGVGN